MSSNSLWNSYAIIKQFRAFSTPWKPTVIQLSYILGWKYKMILRVISRLSEGIIQYWLSRTDSGRLIKCASTKQLTLSLLYILPLSLSRALSSIPPFSPNHYLSLPSPSLTAMHLFPRKDILIAVPPMSFTVGGGGSPQTIYNQHSTINLLHYACVRQWEATSRLCEGVTAAPNEMIAASCKVFPAQHTRKQRGYL